MSTSSIIYYYAYIVECSDGSFYVGKTTNLTRRISQHNGMISGGAKYTRMRRPVILRYYEEHSSNKAVCEREACLKHLNHKEKESLIKNNPFKKY